MKYFKYFSAVAVVIIALSVLAACRVINRNLPCREAYTGTYSEKNGAFVCTDAVGRELTADSEEYEKNGNSVGVFYFLWLGEHGTPGPYDNNKIVSETPTAINSEAAWKSAGGGEIWEQHFWGEPLYGYYVSSDEWVIRKHLQLLTDAGVDYIIFDTTNGIAYIERAKQVIRVWYEYYEQGVDVPKIAFYTNSNAKTTMETVYSSIYNNKSLYYAYPELDNLWFKWDGKPLIIGTRDGISQEMQDYFTIKLSQWPTEGKKTDGWAWMEFSRSMSTRGDNVYRDSNGEKMMMSVSVAQHSDTVTFSYTAWYGANDRTRCWHDGANDTSEDAILYGYNFAEQWENAISYNTPTIFVTGWNEWTAQRQSVSDRLRPIRFVDCADPNTSRDIEPMNGLFGDNYYTELIYYLRRYKGVEDRVNVGDYITLDINGSFSQWDNPAITAVYSDYTLDTIERMSAGYGDEYYYNNTGRNDFCVLKTAHNENTLYFYAETFDNIVANKDEYSMVLFLKTSDDATNWNGYTYAVNLQGRGVLSRCKGGWDWEKVCDLEIQVKDNKMMFALPYDKIEIDGYGDGLVDIEFKWADNFQPNDDGEYDIFTFYSDGDAAPMGRLNYLYSDVKRK